MFRTLILNGAGSDDSADLVELNRLIFALAQQLHRLVSVSYLEVVPSAARAAGESTGLLFKAVIAGEDPADVAMQLGLDLAPAHLVLRLSVSPHPQRRAGHGGQSQHAQEHRILAAVLGRLAAHHGAALLAAPATHQGLVLIAGNPTWASVCAIVKRIEGELGIAITAVGEQADLAATTAATVNTRELEHLVRRLGLKPGTYRMEDLALEYQLTRGSPGRDTFVRILAPLENYPDLLETLAVHLANEKNRQRTATMLGLHANTVDNRLRRIAQLTGVDPMQPSGLATLHAAMIVAEFTQAS